MRRNTEERWGSVSIGLHWTVAGLVLLVQVPAGIAMLRVDPGMLQDTLFTLHKNVGLIVLALAVFRLGWRLANPVPALPDDLPGLQARLARLTHVLLYALLFLLPISGFLFTAFGGFPVPLLLLVDIGKLVPASEPQAEVWKAIHHWAQWALYLVVTLHVLGALQHALIRRDGVFQRMLGRR
jgi:cytochrome b561